MGRPYLDELKELPVTYQWALETDHSPITGFAKNCIDIPLLSVGSGGAHTSARMVATLHEYMGGISKAITPLDLVAPWRSFHECAVAILSASGRNADIKRALRYSASAEPREILALCMATQTPLSEIAEEYRYVTLAEFEPPYVKDGFLAVNSLLATCVLLLRAYEDLLDHSFSLPSQLRPPDDMLGQLESQLCTLLTKDSWIILYSGWGYPVAVDIESKLVEAALGHALLADYRNFGHGRHHWLAKRGTDTGVLMLTTPEDKELADRTASLLPDGIPLVRLHTHLSGPSATIDLLYQAFTSVYLLGQARGIDPGRPGVPDFGRRLYNISIPSATLRQPKHRALPNLRSQTAIMRKARCHDIAHLSEDAIARWVKSYRAFVQNLQTAEFGAIVFDYDGTLCDPRIRHMPPCEEIADRMNQLLKAGVVLGIATGRGESVREALQEIITPKYWHRVLVGYCNGSDVACLEDLDHPDCSTPTHESLDRVRNCLYGHLSLCTDEICRFYPSQISIRQRSHREWKQTRAIVMDSVQRAKDSHLRILESSHSIDVIAPNVSKIRLVEACENVIGQHTCVLSIGDKGEWPGNDYDLLSQPYSLSVDTVSPDPETCWNLCLAGHRGVQATLDYLKALVVDNGTAQFMLKRMD